jgi:hypothetical protein
LEEVSIIKDVLGGFTAENFRHITFLFINLKIVVTVFATKNCDSIWLSLLDLALLASKEAFSVKLGRVAYFESLDVDDSFLVNLEHVLLIHVVVLIRA